MLIVFNLTNLHAQEEPDSLEFSTQFDDSLIYQTPNLPRPLANAVVRFPNNASVYLNWSPLNGATSYVVTYRNTNDSNWVSLTAAGTSVVVTGLALNQDFVWRVRIAELNTTASGNTEFSTRPQREPLVVSEKLYNQLSDWFVRQDSTKTFCDFLAVSDAHVFEKLSFIQAYAFDNAFFTQASLSATLSDWYPAPTTFTLSGCLPERAEGCGCKVISSGTNFATPIDERDEDTGVIIPKERRYIARDGNDRTFVDRLENGASKFVSLRQDEGSGGMTYQVSNIAGGTNDPSSVTTASGRLGFFLGCYRNGSFTTNLPLSCSCERPLVVDYKYESNLLVNADKRTCLFSKGAAAQAEDMAFVTVWNRATGDLTALDAGHFLVGRRCNSSWNPDFWIQVLNLGVPISQYLISSSTTGSNLPTPQQIDAFIQALEQLIQTPFTNNINDCGTEEQYETLVSGENILTLRPNAPLQINLFSAYYLRTRGFGCWRAKAAVASSYYLAGVVESELTKDPECCADRFGTYILGSLSTPPDGDVELDAPKSIGNLKEAVGVFLSDFGDWYDVPSGPSSNTVLVNQEFDLLRGVSCVLDGRQLLTQQETVTSKTNASATIFPNLVSDKMRLRLVTPAEESMRCDVFDVQGRLAFTFLVDVQPGDHEYDFPQEIASLLPGLYFASITVGDARFTHRFVKTNIR